MADTHPSTAHYDENGVYVPDPLNQPLAEHEKLGHFSARDLGQLEHISKCQGYCEHGKLGGCEKD
jgi:hypothetical protein